jgi:predicted phage terminase large subunit-like protein
LYQKLFPYIKIRQDSTAFMRIANTSGGARRQYTTKSSITGDHGHIRLDDDQMDFQSARSDAEVERCIEGFKAYATRSKKNAYVPYILVMQRLSNQDTSTYVFDKNPNIDKIVLPAWDNGKIQPPNLKENYIDGYLDPVEIGKEKLAKMKLQLGDLQYLAEFGQDCENKEGYMYDVQKSTTIEQKGISIAVCDPSDDGDCYTASVFAYVYDNKCHIYDVIYTKDNSDITIPLNVQKAKENKVTYFFIENDGLGAIYAKQVYHKYPLVKKFNAKGNKDDRIHSKANLISKHFVFHQNAPSMEYENAINALTTYKKVGSNKYKDFPDALTSLCAILEKNNLINFYGN